jgi:hypothetical protein
MKSGKEKKEGGEDIQKYFLEEWNEMEFDEKEERRKS